MFECFCIRKDIAKIALPRSVKNVAEFCKLYTIIHDAFRRNSILRKFLDSKYTSFLEKLFFQVNLFKEYIVQAFPDGDDLILDSEVLMVDNETGQPLPFGTLGIHKVRVTNFVPCCKSFFFHSLFL